MQRVNYSSKFLKQYKRSPIPIQKQTADRLDIFKRDPFNSKLNNHKLTGNFSGCRSINITGDWRAIYSQRNGEIIFELLGTHNQLYKK